MRSFIYCLKDMWILSLPFLKNVNDLLQAFNSLHTILQFTYEMQEKQCLLVIQYYFINITTNLNHCDLQNKFLLVDLN